MTSHRSRLCGAYLDVPRPEYERTVAFWQAALERDGKVEAEDPSYTSFGDATPGVELLVQAIGEDSPRIHLDIETDDIDAEVRRLGALGATELERIDTWVVMRDPVGLVFCIVPVQNAEAFAASAMTWAASAG